MDCQSKFNSKIKKYKFVNIWLEEDLIFLKENYLKLSYDKLANILNRSPIAISIKLKSLNLYKKTSRKKWIKEDDEKLQQLCKISTLSIKDIAEELGKSCNSVRLRVNKLKNTYRSDRHLRDLNYNSFYTAFKQAKQRGTICDAKCCICMCEDFIDLHHIDGNRKNNKFYNIAFLCPNHHREVENGGLKNKVLFASYRRLYSDGSCGESIHNCDERLILTFGSEEQKQQLLNKLNKK